MMRLDSVENEKKGPLGILKTFKKTFGRSFPTNPGCSKILINILLSLVKKKGFNEFTKQKYIYT